MNAPLVKAYGSAAQLAKAKYGGAQLVKQPPRK